MSATEELRRLLDERRVEWGANDTHRLLVTSWKDASGHSWAFMEHRDGSFAKLTAYHLTPEQAIAATLGSCNCSNSERTDATRLPHFWTHDGTLHIELPKLPESISVRLPDQRDREVGSARVWQYTRDSGTCQKVYLVETSDDLIESWHPIGVYLSSKAAGDCAEALRGEVDGIRQFARVVELKVVDE